jgi:transcriptional regulator with XRE-family HTH domain
LKETLKQLQRVFSVSLARKITHQDLSNMTGVNKRSIDEWMRGGVNPPPMIAIFELLSKLPEKDALEILDFWKKH